MSCVYTVYMFCQVCSKAVHLLEVSQHPTASRDQRTGNFRGVQESVGNPFSIPITYGNEYIIIYHESIMYGFSIFSFIPVGPSHRTSCLKRHMALVWDHHKIRFAGMLTTQQSLAEMKVDG